VGHSSSAANFSVPGLAAGSAFNLASDGTGTTHSPAGGGQDNVPLASMNSVSTALGTEDLHITGGSAAQDTAADLSSVFNFDIGGGARSTPWDVGADDILATTAVDLVSFTAVGLDGMVVLEWQTASELDNLGFHLYRATAPHAPYERITARPIPGLGSSPEGARYGYPDSPLPNGRIYFYRLEDIETSGKTELHGPVAATPRGGLAADEPKPTLITQGEPESVSLRVLVGRRRPRPPGARGSPGAAGSGRPAGDPRKEDSTPSLTERCSPRGAAAACRRAALRLSRLGQEVAFHLEPDEGSFAPGSVLYFWSEGEAANPYGREAIYELQLGVSGQLMPATVAAPLGAPAPVYLERLEREENRFYQAGSSRPPTSGSGTWYSLPIGKATLSR
jgi:hypothetical protein